MTRPNFYAQLVTATMVPIVASVGLLFLALLKWSREEPWTGIYTLFLLLTYCVFPAVSQSIFQVFSCDDGFDEGSFLRLDYNISCADTTYKIYYAYAMLMIFIYPIGIPLFYAASLFSARRVLNPSPTRLAMSVKSVLRRSRDTKKRASLAGLPAGATLASRRMQERAGVEREESKRKPKAAHETHVRADAVAGVMKEEHKRLRELWASYEKLDERSDPVEEASLREAIVATLHQARRPCGSNRCCL